MKYYQWSVVNSDSDLLAQAYGDRVYSSVVFGGAYYHATVTLDGSGRVTHYYIYKTADLTSDPAGWTCVLDVVPVANEAYGAAYVFKQMENTLYFAWAESLEVIGYTKSADGTNWDAHVEVDTNHGHAAFTWPKDIYVLTTGAAGADEVYVFFEIVATHHAHVNMATSTVTDDAAVNAQAGYMDAAQDNYYYPAYVGGDGVVRVFQGTTVSNSMTACGFTATQLSYSGLLARAAGGQVLTLYSSYRTDQYECGVWSAVTPASTSSRTILGFEASATNLNPVPTFFYPRRGGDTDAYVVFRNGGLLYLQTVSGRGPWAAWDNYALLGTTSGGAAYFIYRGAFATLAGGELALRQDSMFDPVRGTIRYPGTAFGASVGVFLADNSDNAVFAGWLDRDAQVPERPNTAVLTEASQADLGARVYEAYATQTAAAIVDDVMDKYCLFLWPSSIASDATTYSVTFNGEAVADVLRWYCCLKGKVVYWAPGTGAVTTDAGTTDGGQDLTENAIAGCVKSALPLANRAVAVGGGTPLRSIKTRDIPTRVGWRTLEVNASMYRAQAGLDTYNAAVLANANIASHYLQFSGALATRPLVGRTVGIQYDKAPISIAAPTQYLVAAWGWDEYEASFTAYDALHVAPRGVATATASFAREDPPLMLTQIGRNGFVESGSVLAGFVVAHADTDALLYATAHVGVAGSYKIRVWFMSSDGGAGAFADSGQYYAAQVTNAVDWGWNLVPGANFDLAGATQDDWYCLDSPSFAVTAPCIVGFAWAKDDNGGGEAGNLYAVMELVNA